MFTAILPPLASVDAARPVFMIVMGIFLMVFAWRMAREMDRWTARFLVAGAFLLCFGYAFLIPMYEAGIIGGVSKGAGISQSQSAIGWHAVKVVVMNSGWLFLGLGLGLHSGLIRIPAALRISKSQPQHVNAHESAA